MPLEDCDVNLFENRIANCFAPSSPTFKCIFLGSQCQDVHLVLVPARIGVRVEHPRDLETRYWIRSRVSEHLSVSRDLRRTMQRIDSIDRSTGVAFTVAFMDQHEKNLKTNRPLIRLGLLSDWFGDLLLVKHNEDQVLDIELDEIDDVLDMLISAISQGYIA